MHEVSLMKSLIRQVQSIVAEQGGGRVASIEVSVGPLSGVEPLLLQSAFEQLAPATGVSRAELNIRSVKLCAICRDCDHSFQVNRFHFQCPACKSKSVRVTSGDDFRLVSLEVVDESPSCHEELPTR